MTTLTSSPPSTRHRQRVATTPLLDWLVAIAGFLFVSGIYFDGWAHSHGRVDDSFFTIYHAVMYSGYALAGAIFVLAQLINVRRGYSFNHALPQGYMLGLMGVLLFGVAGIGDLIWHTLFGIEEGIEALLSPTHVLLGMSGFLIASTPLRSAWSNPTPRHNLVSFIPVLLSALAMICFITFFTQYSYFTREISLLVGRRPASLVYMNDITGIMSLLIPTLVITSMILYLLRRWALPIGTVTFLVATNGFMMTLMGLSSNTAEEFRVMLTTLSLGFLVCGILGDILLAFIQPSVQHPTRFRLFATVLPSMLMLGMLITLHINGLRIGEGGLWWEVHMLAGVPTLGAFTGYFLSHLLVPPSSPTPA